MRCEEACPQCGAAAAAALLLLLLLLHPGALACTMCALAGDLDVWLGCRDMKSKGLVIDYRTLCYVFVPLGYP